MFIIDSLPTVNKCCFCINLKCGTVLIAILGILSLGLGAYSSYSRACKDKNTFQKLCDYMNYVVLATKIFVFITSLVLLYGVIASKPQTATWFMYAVLFSILVFLVFFVISLIAGVINKNCTFPFIDVISAALHILLWFYFVVVVKSYQSEM